MDVEGSPVTALAVLVGATSVKGRDTASLLGFCRKLGVSSVEVVAKFGVSLVPEAVMAIRVREVASGEAQRKS